MEVGRDKQVWVAYVDTIHDKSWVLEALQGNGQRSRHAEGSGGMTGGVVSTTPTMHGNRSGKRAYLAREAAGHLT